MNKQAFLKELSQKVKVRDWCGICMIIVSAILIVNCIIQLSFKIQAGINMSTAVSIIGGADGPTSIFIAGKIGTPWGLYVITVIVVVVTLFHFLQKYKKH